MIEITAKWIEEEKDHIIKAIQAVVNSIYYYGNEAPRMLSVQFVTRVREDIVSQVFVSKWSGRGQRYSTKEKDEFPYKEWKEKQGLIGMGFWRLYGDLVLNIQSIKMNEGWFGGIPSGIKDRGGKNIGNKGPAKSIAMYASILEYGGTFGSRLGRGGDHPARPVFKYSLQQFAYNESPIIGERVLAEIAKEWK